MVRLIVRISTLYCNVPAVIKDPANQHYLSLKSETLHPEWLNGMLFFADVLACRLTFVEANLITLSCGLQRDVQGLEFM